MGKDRRQLNISAPLLSVRKHLYPRTSAALTVGILTEKKPPGAQFSLLVDRSAEDTDQVTKPVAVPFLWEKTPGRPKRDSYPFEEGPAITPRLPPGRLFEVGNPRTSHERIDNTRNLSGESWYSARLNLAGKIFGEKSSSSPRPGRLVDVKHMAGRVRTREQTSGGNPRVQNHTKCQDEVFTTTGHTSLLERLNKSLTSDGESDDEFSDALDTLCPSDSLSLDSGASGLSSSYHQNCGSSGNFAADLQYRDFMMSRFLPEAQAAVMHMPQYVAKNQKVVIEKIAKKAVPTERKPLLKQKGLNAWPSSNQHMEYPEIEDEDEEDDDPKIRMGKTRGIFRRLCAFGSHSKTKSWMKLKTQPSKPYSDEVKQLTKNSYRGPFDKCAYDAISWKLNHSGVAPQELLKVQTKFRGEPRQLSCSSYKMEDRLSPTTCLRSGGVSAVSAERPHSLFSKEVRFRGLPKPMEPKTDKTSAPVKEDIPVTWSRKITQ